MFSGLGFRDRVRRIKHPAVQWIENLSGFHFEPATDHLPHHTFFKKSIASMFTSQYLTAGNLLWSRIALINLPAFTLVASEFVELHNAGGGGVMGGWGWGWEEALPTVSGPLACPSHSFQRKFRKSTSRITTGDLSSFVFLYLSRRRRGTDLPSYVRRLTTDRRSELTEGGTTGPPPPWSRDCVTVSGFTFSFSCSVTLFWDVLFLKN